MQLYSLLFFPFFHFHPIFLLISLFLYFLPAYLARNKPNFTAILLLNLLAGWTFIGWIIALVWALSSQPQAQTPAPAQPAAGSAAQPAASPGFFCNACGKPCVPGASFCSSCGAALPYAKR
jgi:Superinfection immunity protein